MSASASRSAATSSSGEASSPTAPKSSAPAARRKASLLRDYYNLPATAPSAGASAVSSTAAPATKQDPLDPDSGAAFDARKAYAQLVKTSSLADLLRYQSRLLSEIRELDGERQSLVYNHHHELVAASDTIRKMKARADSLEPSLDSLRTAFSEMSHLCADLAVPSEMLPPRTSSGGQATDAVSEQDLIELAQLPRRLGDLFALANRVAPTAVPTPSTPSSASLAAPRPSISRGGSAASSSSAPLSSPSLAPAPEDAEEAERERERESRRRAALVEAAEELWKEGEPRLEAASSEGVRGAKEVLAEARAVMREGRQASKAAQA